MYFRFVSNMTVVQKAKFDLDLAPVELKEKTIDQQNAEQMRILTGGKKAKPVPLPNRRRSK